MKAILTLAFWLPLFVYGQTVYNANFQALDFSDNTSVPVSGTAGAVNAKYLYTNVITINGQVIDALVTIIAKDNGVTINAVDKTIQAANNFESDITIGNTSPLADGGVTYKFEFIKGGSVASPELVVLQNMMLNSYDIDGNGGRYQYQEFGGFSMYTVNSTTTLRATIQPNGMTRFQGNGTNATSGGNNITLADNWRIRASFNAMSSFTTRIGGQSNGSQAFFSMLFAGGAAFSSPINLVNPTVNPKTSSTNSTTVTGSYQLPSAIASGVTITAFSVLINGVTYTTSNGLTYSDGTWTVNTQSIPNGTYNVYTSVSYSNNYTLIDQTTNELVISNTTPVDLTQPTILSIKRNNPLNQFIGYSDLVAKNYVDFEVVFSESVQGVTSDDFQVSGPGGYQAIISTVTPVTASIYQVRVSSIAISNTGDLNLDLKAGSNVADIAGNLLSNTDPAIHEYYIITTGALSAQAIRLSVTGSSSNTILEWSMETSSDDDVFVIETSASGTNWELLGLVKRTTQRKYQFIDVRNLPGDKLYRVSLALRDGIYLRSNIVLAKAASTEFLFQIKNNPVKHGRLNVLIYRPGIYSLISMTGSKCFSSWLDAGDHQVNVSGLRYGSYVFVGMKQSGKVLIQ
jgi:hypothetical protein